MKRKMNLPSIINITMSLIIIFWMGIYYGNYKTIDYSLLVTGLILIMTLVYEAVRIYINSNTEKPWKKTP